MFYQLPQHGQYYPELVNRLAGPGVASAAVQAGREEDDALLAQHGTVTVLFSPFDRLALERVVGSTRAKRMLSKKQAGAERGGGSGGGTFMFC